MKGKKGQLSFALDHTYSHKKVTIFRVLHVFKYRGRERSSRVHKVQFTVIFVSSNCQYIYIYIYIHASGHNFEDMWTKFYYVIFRLDSLAKFVNEQNRPKGVVGGGGWNFEKIMYQPLWSLEGNFVCINYSTPYEVYGDTNDSGVVEERVGWGVEIRNF